MMKTLHQHKMKQQRLIMRERAARHQREQAKIEFRRDKKHKEIKKQIYRTLGKMEKKKERKKNE